MHIRAPRTRTRTLSPGRPRSITRPRTDACRAYPQSRPARNDARGNEEARRLPGRQPCEFQQAGRGGHRGAESCEAQSLPARPPDRRSRDSARRRCFSSVSSDAFAYLPASSPPALASRRYLAMSFSWSLTMSLTKARSNRAPDSAARRWYSARSFTSGSVGGVTPTAEATVIAF